MGGLRFIALITFVQCIFGSSASDPEVVTPLGTIKGLAASNGNYSMYLGIPYGTVNSSNPFGAASEYGAFSDTFEANDDSAMCPQIEEFNNTVTGTLDCLRLNIYVPDTATSTNLLPVLVWIYGGNFKQGFAGRYVYGPKFFASQDIILVTINYRVGPYGFMCLDTPEVPGNQGLKDQRMALRWVKENIESFGGDTDKTTLWGESAGAVSVDMHLIFDQEDLFNRAILQSASSLSPNIYAPIKNASLVLAEKLGYSAANSSAALTYLATANTGLVIKAVSDLGLDLYFKPCVEKKFDNVTRFVTDNWIAASMAQVKNMPILIGSNDYERMANNINATTATYSKVNVIKQQLVKGFDIDNSSFANMTDYIKHFYFGDDEIDVDSKWDVINFESDFIYIHPVQRSIQRYLNNNAGNVYYYVFCYTGDRNFVKSRYNIKVGGANHADEIGYLFDVAYMTDTPSTNDQLIIDSMTTMWANFVKYGNPTPETTDLLTVQWTPNTQNSSRYFLNISSDITMESRPFKQRMTFWDLFYKVNSDLQIVYPGNNK